MKFNNISFFSSIGGRSYQEDDFFYNKSMIVISDGVGDRGYGKIASSLIVRNFSKEVKLRKPKISINELESIVILIQNLLQKELDQSSRIVAATLAAVVGRADDIVSINIGDCRIYHIDKKGKVIWKSRDHSQVQELLDAGIISETQMRNHPKRNVLTRYLSSGSEKSYSADLYVLNPSVGDRIFLCTDGVRESISDKDLKEIIEKTNDNAKVINKLEEICRETALDNSTAIIATIGK